MSKIYTILAVGGLTLGTVTGPALAAPPTIGLEGSIQVITFTTPGIYDFSANESSSDGVISNATLISHDLAGKIDGIIIDKGSNIELTTEIKGTCKRSGGVTVIKEKMKGFGDLGNGDQIFSRGQKRTEVHGSGAGTTLFSVVKIKTCTRFKQPFSEKYSTQCGSGGGQHETVIGAKGDWQVRMELQQPVVGEILGTGSIMTSIHSSQFKRTTEVIVAGRFNAKEGTAKLKMTPLFDGGDGPVTILAQVVAGDGVRWPAVINILEVKGKLLGQKFNEVVF